ncbi:exopolyphosphatase/guanosine-5'-triphosphate,3'-diphosphate pyrophosphatase [Rhodoligotrophos appendicifer]|uniref:exopolyphosphatase n=1 Tax=Rhodoligotrophos appendicifer TaxID=987056 RepID=UPI00117FB33F|nr:exopolyphosphatase [Rhodoligotrophos appendicifer]
MKRKKLARAEPPKYQPVGIVDIGSNSVRLVVYDGPNRAPAPIFNEKIACGLGRGLALTGRLSDDATQRAVKALRRFRLLCEQMGAEKIYAVATAAARDAENGPNFIEMATEALGHRINVLSGKKEAELAARGVLSGIPDADGIVGDLGGGSLELVEVKDGEITDGVTVPLGPLRLMDLSGNSMEKARKIVDDTFADLPILQRQKGRSFYSVGGTWRNLAKLHMAQTNYPLQVLHHYRMTRPAARSLASLVSGLSADTVREIPAIQKTRADTLPYGALVLDRMLKKGKAKDVIVSAFGLREGLIFSKLEKNKRKRDPLIVACIDFARRYARSVEHEYELCDWTDQLFGGPTDKETPEEQRLRYAACFLADIGWRTHPNYRGERSVSLISQASFVGVDHPGRIFLAFTVFFRYEGPLSDSAPQDLMRMVDDDVIARARLISAAQRLAYVMSGAMPGMLPRIGLSMETPKALTLTVPKSLEPLLGERVERAFSELALLAGRAPLTKIVDD